MHTLPSCCLNFANMHLQDPTSQPRLVYLCSWLLYRQHSTVQEALSILPNFYLLSTASEPARVMSMVHELSMRLVVILVWREMFCGYGVTSTRSLLQCAFACALPVSTVPLFVFVALSSVLVALC